MVLESKYFERDKGDLLALRKSLLVVGPVPPADTGLGGARHSVCSGVGSCSPF